MTSGSLEAHARLTVSELFAFLRAQGDGDYIGEAVSQLEHSLQTAALAKTAQADPETILAALLHDVGRFIPAAEKMPKFIALDGTYLGRASHEVLGERYLRQLGFSEKVCRLVGGHVDAKRYLCATEKGYWEALSPSSKRTLEYQGGIYNDAQVAEAQRDPLLHEMLAIRKWDDQAKVAGAQTPPLEAYEDMAVECLLSDTLKK